MDYEHRACKEEFNRSCYNTPSRSYSTIKHATRKENGKEMLARFDVDEFSIS